MTVVNAWQELQASLVHGPACLVWVERVQGSAPREAGAWMAVPTGLAPGRMEALVGSIGGGHLEYQALAHARAVLQGRAEAGVLRYALGPSLGQCCGGVVHLGYARVQAQDLPHWQHLQRPRMPVAVFGAGHVGQALVRLLQHLPCQTTWVDSRPGMRAETDARAEPAAPWAPRATWVQADPVQDAVADLSPGSRVLILTHSHAEDWEILLACLARQHAVGDLPFLGLIGSASKWASFRRRLIARGLDAAAVDAVHCPMGVPGVQGKEPEVIAVAVAAQLMQTRSL
ncbi:xanthine dehydrogenase accessory protein XdhC [Comamonas sp. GB3 AK4-5]|uniref:xanthine dehydrogenase accessory protein XdhC n=1 Tax=Comamonas sp. GB3 AK4-5 TaxID=3231487 RepID=UPI00351EEEF7